MSWKRIIIGSAFALGTGACATGMSEDECIAADWRALGEQDGLYGEVPDKFNDRAKQCSAFGVVADLALYKQGRDFGLETYCTPQSGYETGRAGQPYRNVCPIETEAAFLDEYALGKKLHDLTQDHDDALARYEDAVIGINSNRHELQRARDRYNENTLSDDDRAIIRDQMRDHRRQIEQYEYDLPLLEAEIDRTRDALDDYRAYLKQIGRL